MSEKYTKDSVIANKKNAIKILNNLLEKYINDSSEDHLKKANLLAYWIQDYVRAIDFEEQFDPTRNISYKRGNVVKLNFGFNIGSEYGGLHYGVVLDNKNDHSSPVLTIIPLTSIKEGKIVNKNSVILGDEIYKALKSKYEKISQILERENTQIDEKMELITFFSEVCSQIEAELSAMSKSNPQYEIKKDQLQSFLRYSDDLKKQCEIEAEDNKKKSEYLKKIGKEVNHMKEGSIALVNQITTVSKIRIFDPRNLHGVLSGVSLSEDSMKKIDAKVKELFVFET